jgi:enamine deaminase RidA (YjgF/YER057c/UK114 family)
VLADARGSCISTILPDMKLTVTDRNGRKCVATGSPWEPVVGYSRAIRDGNAIFVTGTVGLEPDGQFRPTARDQARRAMEIIVAAISALGGEVSDVVRTRIYVTDIEQWKEVGAVHREFFDAVRPATTMVQVARLIDPQALVEIEADAIVRGSEGYPMPGQ